MLNFDKARSCFCLCTAAGVLEHRSITTVSHAGHATFYTHTHTHGHHHHIMLLLKLVFTLLFLRSSFYSSAERACAYLLILLHFREKDRPLFVWRALAPSCGEIVQLQLNGWIFCFASFFNPLRWFWKMCARGGACVHACFSFHQTYCIKNSIFHFTTWESKRHILRMFSRSFDLIYRTLASFPMGDIFMISNVSDIFQRWCQRRLQRWLSESTGGRVTSPAPSCLALTCWRHTGHLSARWSYSSHCEGLPEPRGHQRNMQSRLCNLNWHYLK